MYILYAMTVTLVFFLQKEISEVHKKLSTLAIQSIPPTLPWTNRQLVTSPHPSPVIASVSVAPTNSDARLLSNQKVAASYTPQDSFRTSQQTSVNNSSSSVKSQFSNSPHSVTNQHLDQFGHGKHSSPFIQAQKSPLNYDVMDSLDSHGNSSIFINNGSEIKVPDSSSFKELTPVGDGFTADYSSEYLHHAPLPPPLSIALQVPTLSNSIANTASSKITHTSAGGFVNVNSGPMFDVTGFLNSLTGVKREDSESNPQFLSNENATDSLSSTSIPTHLSVTTTSSSPLLPVSMLQVADTQPSVCQEHVPQTVDVSGPILSRKDSQLGLSPPLQGLEAPDLSVSVFSTATEEILNSKENINHHDMLTKNQMAMGNMLLHSEQGAPKQNVNGWFSLSSHISDS